MDAEAPRAAADRAAPGTAAQLVGMADRMVAMTADYARTQTVRQAHRIFQAVKHLLADARLKVDFARPAVYRAAWSVATAQHVAQDVSMAKALASDALDLRRGWRCRSTGPSATPGSTTSTSS